LPQHARKWCDDVHSGLGSYPWRRPSRVEKSSPRPRLIEQRWPAFP